MKKNVFFKTAYGRILRSLVAAVIAIGVFVTAIPAGMVYAADNTQLTPDSGDDAFWGASPQDNQAPSGDTTQGTVTQTTTDQQNAGNIVTDPSNPAGSQDTSGNASQDASGSGAAGTDTNGTSGGQTAGGSGESGTDSGIVTEEPWADAGVTGSVEPTLAAPTVDVFAGEAYGTVPSDNLYTLTVATGISPGKTVHYFAIRYVDSQNASQTKYIFPHEDAFKASFNYVQENAGENEKLNSRHDILRADLQYQVLDFEEPEPLAAWSVDEYLFRTESPVSRVTGIEVFMTGGSWAVQGMTVSKVLSMDGFGEYGFYSGKYFFALQKERIVELVKKKSGTLTLSPPGDHLYNVGGSDSIYFGLEASKDKKDETTPLKDLYSIRLDIADTLDAGLETYLNANAQDSGIIPTGFVEDIALEIEYSDVNGWTRSVTLPVLLSVLGQQKESGDVVRTMGIAQRGDTIAFTGCLPEYSELLSSKIYVGSAARDRLKETGGFDYYALKKQITDGSQESQILKRQESRATELDSDAVALAGISIYKGTCRMSNTENGIDVETGASLPSYTYAYSFSDEYPLMYYTTTREAGFLVNPGTSDSVSFKPYNSSDPLVGTQSTYNYMIRLRTDTMESAGTKGDIKIRLTYVTSTGTTANTKVYNVREEVQKYMGYWPSEENVRGNFACTGYATAGRVVEFPIALPEISGFTGADISLANSADEWQMSGISVAFVSNIGRRRVYAQKITGQGDTSSYRIVRTADKFDIPPFPMALKKLFMPGDSYSIDFSTGTATAPEELDYESMRYSMTYEQTKEDLGFTKSKKIYDVTVTVANDSSKSNVNGDSGSQNQFFFQLQFKNGSSAFVLANQQLTADGFRAGYNENFSIAVNRDYGAVTAIRIVPEMVSEDSELFDKLNIDKISVTERANGGSVTQFVFDSVGWIDIDFRDASEDSSLAGREGKTLEELASVYTVSFQRKVVNLLCEVTTLPWDTDYLQVEGSISCELGYIDSNDEPQTIGFDVVERMAYYMGKTPISFEAPTDPASYAGTSFYKNMGTVSDPEWMLRPNHTDRFILPAIPDLKSLKTITLYATSRNNKPGSWVIGDICISQVLSDGTVQLTADNEYYRSMETQPLCQMESDSDKETLTLPAGQTQFITLPLSENTLVWSEDESWVTPVSRLPDSTNDTLNVYLYPKEGIRNIADSYVGVVTQYTVPFGQPQQARGSMTALNSGTENAVYVAKGLRATGMNKLNSVTLRCADSRMLFDKAIVQQVRDNVIVNTYEVPFFGGSALFGNTAYPTSYSEPAVPRFQKMYVSIGSTTQPATLFAEQNDVAVAFKYRSTIDNGQTEYFSPYIYLTDTGVGKVYPGMMAEIPFEIPYVSEITGYRIASFGNVSVSVEGAQVANYSYSKKVTDEETGETTFEDQTREGVYSFNQKLVANNAILEYPRTGEGMSGDGTLNLLDFTFKTADASTEGESGTNDPVQMTFTYTDDTAATRQQTYYDITPYIQEDEGKFETGSEKRVMLFLPECTNLISVHILPHNDAGDATWYLERVSGTLRLGDQPINRAVNSWFTQSSGGSTIYLQDVTLRTWAAVDSGASEEVTDHMKSMVLQPGQHVYVSVQAAQGFNATAKWLINGTETDVTSTTITNRNTVGFTFTVPENTSAAPQTYSLVIASAVNPTVTDTINITVPQAETTAPSLSTSIGVNGASPELVVNHEKTVEIEGGYRAQVNVEAGTSGYKAVANWIVNGMETDVTGVVIENVTDSGFIFTAPSNTSGAVQTYEIVVISGADSSLTDTITVMVPPEGGVIDNTSTEETGGNP